MRLGFWVSTCRLNQWAMDLHQYATTGSCFLSSSARWRKGTMALSSGEIGGRPRSLCDDIFLLEGSERLSSPAWIWALLLTASDWYLASITSVDCVHLPPTWDSHGITQNVVIWKRALYLWQANEEVGYSFKIQQSSPGRLFPSDMAPYECNIAGSMLRKLSATQNLQGLGSRPYYLKFAWILLLAYMIVDMYVTRVLPQWHQRTWLQTESTFFSGWMNYQA